MIQYQLKIESIQHLIITIKLQLSERFIAMFEVVQDFLASLCAFFKIGVIDSVESAS